MTQTDLVRNLYRGLLQDKWHKSLTIGYDLTNNGYRGESRKMPLYLGEKKPRQGRRVQTAQPDILARREDTRTVDLIVEVETGQMPPKHYYALFGAAVFADNHTPSYETGSKGRYTYLNTLIVVVTLQDREDAELVAESIRQKVSLADLGISDLCVCGGPSGEKAEAEFQELIRGRLGRGIA